MINLNTKIIRLALLIVAIIHIGCQSTSKYISSSRQNLPIKLSYNREEKQKNNTKSWYSYSSNDGSYTSLFPGKPEVAFNEYNSSKDFDKVQVCYFPSFNQNESEWGDSYCIETNKYFKKMSNKDGDKLLKSIINDIMKSDGSSEFSLGYTKKNNYNGRKGYEYVVYNNKYVSAFKCKIFFDVNESTLYKIQVGTAQYNWDLIKTEQASFFLNSLNLK